MKLSSWADQNSPPFFFNGNLMLLLLVLCGGCIILTTEVLNLDIQDDSLVDIVGVVCSWICVNIRGKIYKTQRFFLNLPLIHCKCLRFKVFDRFCVWSDANSPFCIFCL